ncbi:peptidylprolyl isomerase [Dehalogenimonas alkenigignens]|uniref:Peptidyl-prolyl cis-trans isomerase n=1 Tax=Dehalogenimonas alkenigignens TaxID=1217799 RepID=A0A0W0GHR3_9CHLR|nr:peptidylprolyl isomerase [Dehalogenimonas alkenigignens]KTB48105.1 Peptidyl-prolyl cis-trans isomerase (rotamase) - cyclophilin family [Dehalogenimonas alkenigignens]PVV84356.1 peptidylprolyl isomerase [Dehalogenimonas alkenigignens]
MNLYRKLLVVLPLLAILTAGGCGDPKPTYATIETNLGSFKIEFFTKDAPKTVENFISLTEKGFYNQSADNKIIFHRIMKEFMVQTGDPAGTGAGGPGYTFADELPVKRSYEPGIVAMANRGPNTNGSQFFICTGPQAKNLDQNPAYTQFGIVVEGMDVVRAIASVPVVLTPTGELSKPVDPPYIIRITIEKP